MLTGKTEIIIKTMELAEARFNARTQYEAEHGPKKWGVYLPEEKALSDYLMTLDREAVETLEVLMLLGRDEEYHKLGATPEECFLQLKEKRYHHHPDQEIAVYYLTGKNTLKVFLESGLNYLGIVL